MNRRKKQKLVKIFWIVASAFIILSMIGFLLFPIFYA